MNREQRKYLKERIEKIYNERLYEFRHKLSEERYSLPTTYAAFAEKLNNSSKVREEFLKAVFKYLKEENNNYSQLNLHFETPTFEKICTARSEAYSKLKEECNKKEADFIQKERARKTKVLDKIMLGNDYEELMQILKDYENEK